MNNEQLARELTTQQLYVEAGRYELAVQRVRSGDSTQEQLRARQRALQAAAVAYCAAHGHPTPQDLADDAEEEEDPFA
jgi:hypothetical protein